MNYLVHVLVSQEASLRGPFFSVCLDGWKTQLLLGPPDKAQNLKQPGREISWNYLLMLSREISQVTLTLEYPKIVSMTLKVHFEHLKTGNL